MRAFLAGLALLCLASAASARPYTLEDMLKLESYGQMLIAPDGRSAIVERRGAYDSASRYSYGYLVQRMNSQVLRLDLGTSHALRPAFHQEADAGYWAGGFSRSGAKLTVYRLQQDRLRLGVADLKRGSVRWLEGAPDLPLAAPAPVWLDSHRILYLRFKEERLPFVLDHPGVVQKTITARWAAAAEGKLASADLARLRGISEARSREIRELVVVDVESGEARVLFTGAADEFVATQGDNRVAILVRGEAVQPDSGVPITANYEPRRRRLLLLNLRSGTVSQPCGRCDVMARSVEISRLGALVFLSRLDGEPWSAMALRLIGAGRSALDIGTLGPAKSALWLGERLLFQAEDGSWMLGQGDGALRVGIERSARLVAGDFKAAWLAAGGNSLWRLDRSGALKRIHRCAIVRSGLEYLDDSSTGIRAVRRPPSPVLGCRDGNRITAYFGFEAGQPVSAPLSERDELLAVSPKGGAAITLQTDAYGVGYLVLHEKGRKRIVVDRISTHLAHVDRPEALPLVRQGHNGKKLIDWLLLPAGSSRSPLVVVPYQGTVYTRSLPAAARADYFGSAKNALLLVANGYAVLLPSLPAGPPGAPQSVLVRDVDAAIDAAVGTGRVDPERLAAHGHSYGGVNALTLAAESKRFRAIVSASGLSDPGSAYGTVPPAQRVVLGEGVPLEAAAAWYETGQGQFGAPPWIDPTRYRQASSFLEAERITAPLLLIGGDIDYVPMEQAERLFVSLNRMGRDATLLRFYGEGHVVQSPANLRLQWDTILAFLAKALRDETGSRAQSAVQ
ncbi:alpha/beta hydrolase family protein [Sphingomonas sp. M1-B02]|uniref:alpha/beta hydrolase family protein n=1 Tax=Sphingomonas sp. M1-B02 TaxID=3114300 RepID=UPI00223F611B|nr:prolyl oligopeptidase family serine peptidase [Sphingomonas sp. S6-11]UZK67855.1 prolyl oligopeptidase family serine peptidase [Sphingomonas sp. S6-11]